MTFGGHVFLDSSGSDIHYILLPANLINRQVCASYFNINGNLAPIIRNLVGDTSFQNLQLFLEMAYF